MSGGRSQPPGASGGKGGAGGWRLWLRHGLTLLWIALVCALVAPAIATVLLAARTNGLSVELVYSLMLAPLAILYAGPAAFGLGLVFGWMLLGLVLMGQNLLLLRVALAMLIVTLAWALTDPSLAGDPAAPRGPLAQLLDWLVLNLSAAGTALLFTCGWLDRRVHPPA